MFHLIDYDSFISFPIMLLFFFFVFVIFVFFFFFFFFSSRRRHTRWNCDWSSDVCSSDLDAGAGALPDPRGRSLGCRPAGRAVLGSGGRPCLVRRDRLELSRRGEPETREAPLPHQRPAVRRRAGRSEERRVGKECRLQRSV